MKNVHSRGGSELTCISFILLSFFYLIVGIRLLISNFKKGKMIAFLLGFVSFAAFLLGLAAIFIMQHWRFGSQVLYTTLGISLLTLLFIRKKYYFNGQFIGLKQALRILNTNLVFIGLLLFFRLGFSVLSNAGYMPKFYLDDYPAKLYQLQNGKTEDEAIKANQLADAYNNFMERCKKNDFLK